MPQKFSDKRIILYTFDKINTYAYLYIKWIPRVINGIVKSVVLVTQDKNQVEDDVLILSAFCVWYL